MANPSLGRSVAFNPDPSHKRLHALVHCLACSERRLVELHPGDFVVLRRDGTLNLSCPACGAFGSHKFVRFSP